MVGSSSGRPVPDTLAMHGKLTANEARLVAESLQRVHAELATQGRQ